MSAEATASKPTKAAHAAKTRRAEHSPAHHQGHLIGYARVSTTGQDTATQEAKLKAAGCTLIRTETVSGDSRKVAASLRRSSTSFAPATFSSW
jgi:hypothetical protein